MLAALAEVAHRGGYCRPEVDDSAVIDIADGRHPVVERAGGRRAASCPTMFGWIPTREQLFIVTGPNMAGKSTLIRQVALTVLLAQMGSFVPAQSGAHRRVRSRVHAGRRRRRSGARRVHVHGRDARDGAHPAPRHRAHPGHPRRDRARHVDLRRRVDRVGRRRVPARRVGAKTLFATHYHELCALAETHPRVRNVSVAAREWQGGVVFLRKLQPGGASRSFGIEVAKLAGVPAAVLSRAQAILASLEAGGSDRGDGLPRAVLPADGEGLQMGLRFAGPTDSDSLRAATPGVDEVVARIRAVEPDDLTPRQAHELLAELKKKLT